MNEIIITSLAEKDAITSVKEIVGRIVITNTELYEELKNVNLCLYPFYIKKGINCNELLEYYIDATNYQEDYKQLWFNVCEEKKQLQSENFRLKKDSEHWRMEALKFERLYNSSKKQNNYKK